MKTFTPGGIHPSENKLTRDAKIENMPIPALLTVPVAQHLGKPAKALVAMRDTVKKGQVIAEADGFISAPVHAPTSGTIKSIKNHPHPSGQYVKAISITSDGNNEWAEGLNVEPEDFRSLTREDVISRVKDAGIVGMGGAGFPTHVKLQPPSGKRIDTIILNGAECEPFLTSDHRLMLEHPKEVLVGLEIMASVFEQPVKIYVGIESNKMNAVEIMKEHAPESIKVEALKTKYPEGSEKQLINALTGRWLLEGQLPFDVGCVVQNIATAYAVYEAVCKKKPLIERVFTVSGMEIAKKKNVRAALGTLVTDIMEYCGGLESDNINQFICGGPMMGRAQFTFDIPITKTTSGLLFINNKELDNLRERPCLRCGKCIEACPQGQRPWVLADKAQKKHAQELPSYGLNQCMECGSCAFVCPSKREIVHWIKYSKAVNANIRQREALKKEAQKKDS